MKKVIIVHGWDDGPEKAWFPWLKKELEAKGFEVIALQLPDTSLPRINKWVPALAAAAGEVNEDTYFIGHSMGCQTIVRFLESLSEGKKVGGAVFVAGFFKRLTNLEEDAEVQDVGREWLTTPIDLAKVKSHLPKSIAIFSDDDPWVPLDNQEEYKDKLGSEIIIEHTKGHYSGGRDNCFELPIVVESLLRLAK